MELSDLIQVLRKVEIFDKGIFNLKVAGAHNSQLKGQGLSFEQVRKYDPGDDIKNINWNVTARFREPHVNTYTEDKKRLVWIVMDISGSVSAYASHKTKLDLEIEIAATLVYSFIRENDDVGVIFFSDKVEKVIQPGRGMSSFWHIAKTMVELKGGSGKTDIGNALQFLQKISSKRSLVFLISDFIQPGYGPFLKILEQRNELFILKVDDKNEYELPGVGWLQIKDSETGAKKWVNTSSAGFKRNYYDEYNQSRDYFDTALKYKQHNIISVNTNDDVVEKLMTFMRHRK